MEDESPRLPKLMRKNAFAEGETTGAYKGGQDSKLPTLTHPPLSKPLESALENFDHLDIGTQTVSFQKITGYKGFTSWFFMELSVVSAYPNFHLLHVSLP